MAKQESPDLIVVCVEAQPTNGYMLCTRLKKDESLKGIPVILTSANATADSFEKHKKLKTRAEEYLIKPFEPQVMLEKASALLGVELPAAQEEEVIQMEDEPLGLGDLVEDEEPAAPPEPPAEETALPPEDEIRTQLEARIVELEQALAERDAMLEQSKKTAASSGEILKLKDAKNKADKEVLRLKEELHA